MYKLVTLQIADRVATITLNWPEKRNPISDSAMIDDLIGSLKEINDNRNVAAAILTGAGTAFSSGGNIARMSEALDERREKPAETLAYYRLGIQRIPLAFQELEIPIIAAVNGAAIGAGCDLACMCDIRIASESALFAESFVKLGLISGDGGAWLLPRVIGYSKACEMAFTGDPIDAKEALKHGLVSAVFPDDQLMDKAQELARRIAKNPTFAVRMTKRLFLRGRELSLGAHLEFAASLQAVAQTTDDHQQAVRSILNKKN